MKKIEILTRDQFPLSLTQYSSLKPVNHVIIINPATGVKQKFYAHFAEHMSYNGYDVYTYDYRGIGESSNASIRNLQASFIHWSLFDFSSVLIYVHQQHPDAMITVLGHSLGGQLIGMSPVSYLADNIIFVASQTPYWKHYKGWMRCKVWLLWYLMIPVLVRLIGYFPSKSLGLFENLPKAAALQWARWGKNRNYMFDEVPNNRELFASLKQPALAFSFHDDDYAPIDAVEDLLRYYTNLNISHYHFKPADINRKEIGHFNFFRPAYQEPFWNELLAWLNERRVTSGKGQPLSEVQQ